MFRLYCSESGVYLEHNQEWRISSLSVDELFTSNNAAELLQRQWETATPANADDLPAAWLPPIGEQEVWAAGVTYLRRRPARMEESEEAGGDR